MEGPNFHNKIVLVTGGAGFIGSHVIDRALQLGAEKVVAVDNFVSGVKANVAHLKTEERFELIDGDITDYKFIEPHVEQADYIINEAASKMVVSLKNPEIDLKTNIVGAYNIFQASRNASNSQRIVHASTGSVFGSTGQVMTEKTFPEPNSFYGVSKLAGEKYALFFAKEFGMPISVIRYVHVYGPRQDFSGEAGVVSIFIARVLKNEPPIIFSGGKQVRCFTYVDDQVDATLMLTDKNSAIGQDYTVSSKARITIEELAHIIIEKYGPADLKPFYGEIRYGENPYPVFDTKKIEDLGWHAKTPFEDGLERTKQWVEANLKLGGK